MNLLDATGRLEDQAATLGVALAQWADRDQARDTTAARRAGSTALGSIDTMLRDLYAVRGQLVGEIRRSDDASVAAAARMPGTIGGTP